LVIDDEEPIRLVLGKFLGVRGYEVDSVATVEAGLARARAAPPALIVLDLRLPGGSGYDFLEARRKDLVLAAVPVIVAAAFVEDPEVLAGLGASRVVEKPLDLHAFYATLQEILEECPPSRS
jgi:CheY-like chemotaxis protein